MMLGRAPPSMKMQSHEAYQANGGQQVHDESGHALPRVPKSLDSISPVAVLVRYVLHPFSGEGWLAVSVDRVLQPRASYVDGQGGHEESEEG